MCTVLGINRGTEIWICYDTRGIIITSSVRSSTVMTLQHLGWQDDEKEKVKQWANRGTHSSDSDVGCKGNVRTEMFHSSLCSFIYLFIYLCAVTVLRQITVE
jgi:hypothetical protein